jgi:hypothetical protein
MTEDFNLAGLTELPEFSRGQRGKHFPDFYFLYLPIFYLIYGTFTNI